MVSAIAHSICVRMSGTEDELCSRRGRAYIGARMLEHGLASNHALQEGRRRRAGSQMTILGTGFGDRLNRSGFHAGCLV